MRLSQKNDTYVLTTFKANLLPIQKFKMYLNKPMRTYSRNPSQRTKELYTVQILAQNACKKQTEIMAIHQKQDRQHSCNK